MSRSAAALPTTPEPGAAPEGWLEGLADALGVTRLTPAQVEEILDLAREVAHRTERRNTPLATFLVGQAVAGGHDLAEARRITESLLG